MPALAPLPTIVVVHAHPDDEAIFTGALIRRIADRGGRVVLVTATGGEHGLPSSSGAGSADSVAAVRSRELERSCEILGVARLVRLGLSDSGLPGSAANLHPRALLRSRCTPLAARVARLALAEQAAAIVYDDDSGIYGHPDHVSAHRVGAAAARMADVSAYEVTVDHEHLAGTDHLVTRAAASAGRQDFGAPPERIGIALQATTSEMVAKQAAMSAHASQIDPAEMAGPGFDRIYGREWLTRTRGPAVLEHLATASGSVIPAQHAARRLTRAG